jgi:8-oxo-dGTP diphosphatase
MIDKLAWIHFEDKKILSTRSRGKDKYYIPGGKREMGESDAQALIREIKEELDVTLSEDSLIFWGEFSAQAHGHPEGVMVRMRCYTGIFAGELKPCSEIEEMKWLSFQDQEIISGVDKLIFGYAKERGELI